MDDILHLFAAAEVFIYVFVEIVTKIPLVQRVLLKNGKWLDKLTYILLFGGFSIFGTYIGTPLPSGALSSIRDLGPMIAGLTAGPVVGLCTGLIGGIHRFFMGGFTCIPCSLATVFAGVIAGAIYYFRKGKLLGIIMGMVFAILIEAFHAGLALLMARPFDAALDATLKAIPDMMIANALGMAIAIIIISKEIRDAKSTSQWRELL